MDWWQELLIVAGTVCIAVVGGIMFGRFLSRIRPRPYREASNFDEKQPAQTFRENINTYVEGQKYFAVQGKITEGAFLSHETAEYGTSEAAAPIMQEALAKAKEAETRARVEREFLGREKAEQAAKAAAMRLKLEQEAKEAETRARIEREFLAREKAEQAAKADIMRLKLEQEAKAKEAEARTHLEAERTVREKAEQASNNAAEIGGTSRVACLAEIGYNMKIANTSWNGKPLPFKTNIMDNNPGAFDTYWAAHISDIREAYADMAMANNIVWMVTELGANGKEFESGYIKLCSKIFERLSWVIKS